jgi:hypothetical protein
VNTRGYSGLLCTASRRVLRERKKIKTSEVSKTSEVWGWKGRRAAEKAFPRGSVGTREYGREGGHVFCR